MFFRAVILFLCSKAVAHTITHSVAHSQRFDQISRCGITVPTAEDVDSIKTLENIEKTTRIETSQHICVNTYVHVITGNVSEAINKQQVDAQMRVLNAAFAPHNISFKHINTSAILNEKWGAGDDELEMKTSLRRGDYSALNIYLVDTAKLGRTTALGYCTFPTNTSSGSDAFIRDGCVVAAQSVPGGTSAPYNLGGTVIHEVGHWFSLFHTFENGCEAPGDSVADTPAQKEPTSGCPKRKDTCPDLPGDDPINNYMDYSYDICYEEFTPGQRMRMHNSWATYRQRWAEGYYN